MSDRINVLLVDDHAVVRTGYKTYLMLSDNIGEVYEADCGELGCQIYRQYLPDVVVLDLSMPGFGGLETIRRLLHRHPQCNILVFSMHDEPAFISRALNAGAKGYIDKSSSPEILVSALACVAKGHQFLPENLAKKRAQEKVFDGDKIQQLSAREFDIFCLLANGLLPKEIAEKLCLSQKTISNHGTSIKEKLSVKSVAEMTLLAARQGLISRPDISHSAVS